MIITQLLRKLVEKHDHQTKQTEGAHYFFVVLLLLLLLM